MAFQIFSATKSNTGSIASFSVNSKEGNLWLSLVKQTGTSIDPSGKSHGIYKGGDKVNIKFSYLEAGSLLIAIRNKTIYSVPHNGVSIKFAYYSIEPKTPTEKFREGFSIQIKKDNVDYKSTFSIGVAESLYHYILFALNHIYTANYSLDKKAFEDSQKNKKVQSTNQGEDAEASSSLEDTEVI